ncbi:hypothetical protein EVAR_96998_1 [Eumeta japonica]|uniref:Uncharacterized protein n=1 Tax=Eumeta variegata TaxID=151549 RepID=A0A4C1SS91_EUMVA|nr:hypothetical protein EVAR_96998_1 [Eumeta japonica]
MATLPFSLPPYHSDLNPIEMARIKGHVASKNWYTISLDMIEVQSGTAVGLYECFKQMLTQKNMPAHNMDTVYCKTLCNIDMPLTPAEKQRRYRERRKNNPEKDAESKEKIERDTIANKRLVRFDHS